MAKLCSACGIEKPLSDFAKNRVQDDGYQTQCRSCKALVQRLWMLKSPRGTLAVSLNKARKRHPTTNAVSTDDLMEIWRSQKGLCALTGIEMTWGRKEILGTSMSIDRINQGRGYERDNVRLVCHAINCFRGRMSDYEMFEMASMLLTKRKEFVAARRKPKQRT